MDQSSETTPAKPLYTSDEDFDAHRIRALAIYCSDGRYGEQFDDFLHDHLKLPRYDRLAVPGGPACLTGRYGSAQSLAGIREQIKFLIEAHQLQQVVLIQHYGCAFYGAAIPGATPMTMKPDQDEDLKIARDEVLSMEPSLKVTTAYARLVDNRVQFEPVVLGD